MFIEHRGDSVAQINNPNIRTKASTFLRENPENRNAVLERSTRSAHRVCKEERLSRYENLPSQRAFGLRWAVSKSARSAVYAAFNIDPAAKSRSAPPRRQTMATFSVARNESGPPASSAAAAYREETLAEVGRAQSSREPLGRVWLTPNCHRCAAIARARCDPW